MAEKLWRFIKEAGALGVGSVIFAFVLWVLSLLEHQKGQNIPALWLLLGGCAAFCLGCFMAWSRADDRANDRKPKLAFHADAEGFHLTHLQGDPVRFITISTLKKANGTNVRFDRLDFLSPMESRTLHFRLQIVGDMDADMPKTTLIMFEAGHGGADVSYPVSVSFSWDDQRLEEKVLLSWNKREKRFETRPR